ncbi:MAG: hypothetical protein KatS3mg126_2490 [Lysobacteraceae bacterium]|nr:MAG: hypothetical protein KatS3mg126_2490 [Xanthomonadaceae bacterium]
MALDAFEGIEDRIVLARAVGAEAQRLGSEPGKDAGDAQAQAQATAVLRFQPLECGRLRPGKGLGDARRTAALEQIELGATLQQQATLGAQFGAARVDQELLHPQQPAHQVRLTLLAPVRVETGQAQEADQRVHAQRQVGHRHQFDEHPLALAQRGQPLDQQLGVGLADLLARIGGIVPRGKGHGCSGPGQPPSLASPLPPAQPASNGRIRARACRPAP